MDQQRATAWSITLNNPTTEELEVGLPAGWSLEGQFEEGELGTKHFQGLLRTPQCRFSAVKKIFPRAHIEVCKNIAALTKYVHKSDTRVSTFEQRQSDNIFQSQAKICKLFDWDHWENIVPNVMDDKYKEGDLEKALMSYVDSITRQLILAGERGLEFTAINPMWRSSWLRFGMAILHRHRLEEHKAAEEQLNITCPATHPDLPPNPDAITRPITQPEPPVSLPRAVVVLSESLTPEQPLHWPKP